MLHRIFIQGLQTPRVFSANAQNIHTGIADTQGVLSQCTEYLYRDCRHPGCPQPMHRIFIQGLQTPRVSSANAQNIHTGIVDTQGVLSQCTEYSYRDCRHPECPQPMHRIFIQGLQTPRVSSANAQHIHTGTADIQGVLSQCTEYLYRDCRHPGCPQPMHSIFIQGLQTPRVSSAKHLPVATASDTT